MDPDEEPINKDYENGKKSVWLRLLQECILNLTSDSFWDTYDKQLSILLEEKMSTIQLLRELCEEFGDNEWDDNLYLGDIIEKHLGRYLYENKED